MKLRDRYRGCLLGLAVGDATGTSLEFSRPGTFTPLKDMIGGGPFGLQPGEFTDDTSMALCLAESLIAKQAFDPMDQMERYCKWRKTGKPGCKDYCFDCGSTVSQALSRFEREGRAAGNPYSGSTDPMSAGNGSIMRLAPVPLFFGLGQRDAGIIASGDSSKTTHGTEECIDACIVMAALLQGCLSGLPKEQLFEAATEVIRLIAPTPIAPKVLEILNGSFKTKQPPAVRGTGYVIDCLEAALWAFWHSNTFEEAVLKAANLGNDADTTASTCGQLAGAYYGEQGIPPRWRRKLAMRDLVEKYADELYRLAEANALAANSERS